MQTLIEAAHTGAVETRRKEALEAMAEIARQKGFGDIYEVLQPAPAATPVPATPTGGRELVKNSRRPHMNPYDPESDCFALTKMKEENWPTWAKELTTRAEKPWTVDQLKCTMHKSAMRKIEGKEPLYDAPARNKQLIEASPRLRR